MVIAVTVTFLSVGNFSSGFIYVLIFLAVGGSIGAFIAYRIPMTAMPELVAGFHSLVGLAAVFVAISAFINPVAFNLGTPGNIKLASLIEMAIGAAVGAITFSGSVIAFLKLQGIMSGAPITFKGQHLLNALLLILIVVLTIYLCSTQSSNLFWILIATSFNWIFNYYSYWWCRYASCNFDVKFLFGLGCSWNWIYFRKHSLNYYRCIGRIIWSNTLYIMCKGMNRSFFNVILGGFGATDQTSGSQSKEQRPVKSGNADDAAFLMKNASSVIIVPGYGMAVAQAQHALREMVDTLKKNDIKVSAQYIQLLKNARTHECFISRGKRSI